MPTDSSLRGAHELLLQALPLRDVAEDEHRADDLAVRGVDGREAPLDEAARARLGDEEGLGGQLGDAVARDRELARDGGAALLVHEDAYLGDRPADRRQRVATGERGGGRVDELHVASGVRRDHALGHGAQADRQALLLLRQRKLRLPPVGDVSDHADQLEAASPEALDRDLLAQPQVFGARGP